MKCSKCGSELTEDTKFCSYCGEKIAVEALESANTDINEQATAYDVYQKPLAHEKKTLFDKLKEKFFEFWNKIDLFCKVETIAITVVAFLLVFALYGQKVIPIIFSVLQLSGLVVSLLVHKGKIKCNKNWIKYLILALAIVFTTLNISSYSWLDGIGSREQFYGNFEKVDTPYAAADCVGKDKDAVKRDFLAAGFSSISEEVIEDLDSTETDKYGKVESVSINGVIDFVENKEFKSSSKVIIKFHSYKRISVPISSEEAKNMDTDSILKAFEDAGFVEITTDEVYDLDPDTTKVEFENNVSVDGTSFFEKDTKFPLNADVKIVEHRPYEKYTLKVIIDFFPNLIFSKYDVNFEIDGHTEKLAHGKYAEFEYKLKQGKYTLTFESAESSSVKGTVDIDITGDTEACYKISCNSDRVNVEPLYVGNKRLVGENQAMVPSSASNCKYKNYKDIEKTFSDAGFTNIKTEILYDIVLGFTKEGEVDHVTIDGKSEFNRGDVFAKDADIVITYHMKEEDNPNKKEETVSEKKQTSVSYSTNDQKTAKNGNSGIFAYSSLGGQYYNYWIIDFDEGYVYFFSEGNGSETCDKVKIDSGNLNDVLIITYHEGNSKWSYGLHFKWKNQPDHLVVQDNYGFESDYYTTNLNDALAIKNKKTIYNY